VKVAARFSLLTAWSKWALPVGLLGAVRAGLCLPSGGPNPRGGAPSTEGKQRAAEHTCCWPLPVLIGPLWPPLAPFGTLWLRVAGGQESDWAPDGAGWGAERVGPAPLALA